MGVEPHYTVAVAVRVNRGGTARQMPPHIPAALDWATSRRVARVQPHLVKKENGSILTLPGDPLYPGPADVEPLRETRFVLEDGRWRPVPASSKGVPRA